MVVTRNYRLAWVLLVGAVLSVCCSPSRWCSTLSEVGRFTGTSPCGSCSWSSGRFGSSATSDGFDGRG